MTSVPGPKKPRMRTTRYPSSSLPFISYAMLQHLHWPVLAGVRQHGKSRNVVMTMICTEIGTYVPGVPWQNQPGDQVAWEMTTVLQHRGLKPHKPCDENRPSPAPTFRAASFFIVKSWSLPQPYPRRLPGSQGRWCCLQERGGHGSRLSARVDAQAAQVPHRPTRPMHHACRETYVVRM